MRIEAPTLLSASDFCRGADFIVFVSMQFKLRPSGEDEAHLTNFLNEPLAQEFSRRRLCLFPTTAEAQESGE